MSEPSAQHIMTVRGPVPSEEVGRTSMHEHAFWDCRKPWWTPEPFEHPELTNQPLTVENSAIARWNALAIRDNLFVGAEDFDEQASELSHFVAAGGSCIVDLTCEGIGPYPDLLRRVSEAIGLHIVAGAGFYVHASHPPWLESASVSEVAAAIYNQVTSGIGNTAVLPGIIGEIGTSVDFPPCERTVVKAAARVAARTGTAMNVHTTAPSRHAETIIDLCVTEGLAPERLVFSHLDEVPDPSYHCRVLSSGASIGFDSFGTDFRFGDLWKSPGDTEKMELLLTDLELGYEDQLVMGHDVSLKASLKRFGGLGYDHILRRIVPALVRIYHIDDGTMDKLLVHNPRRLLARPALAALPTPEPSRA